MSVSVCTRACEPECVHAFRPAWSTQGEEGRWVPTGTALEVSFPFLLRLSFASLCTWPFLLRGGPGRGVYQPRGEAWLVSGWGLPHC